MHRRKSVVKQASMRGCVFQPDACREVEGYLDRRGLLDVGEATKEAIRKLLDIIAELGCGKGHITREVVLQATAKMDKMLPAGDSEARAAEVDDYTKVVGVRDVPRLEWCCIRSSFVPCKRGEAGVISSPVNKPAMLQDRLEAIRQRVERSAEFRKSSTSIYNDMSSAMDVDTSKARKQQVYRLSSLEGMPRDAVLTVLGRVAKYGEDELFIEDDTTRVAVELTPDVVQGAYTSGLLCDGSLLLAVGRWYDEKFHVEALGMPAAESREESISAMPGSIDFFGLAPPSTQVRSLVELERASTEHVFVFLSQVHVDVPATLPRVASLISGLSDPAEFNPKRLVVVLCGNFSSKPFEYGDPLSSDSRPQQERSRYASLLEQLADTIHRTSPEVASHAQFIFVPGPGDPSVGWGSLPQLPFPEVFTKAVRRKLPRATFSSNPSRIRFLTHEMLVYRDDLYGKLRKHCLLPPVKEPNHQSLVKTVADQGHLCPLPPRTSGVMWSLDHVMRLYPLPHLVVLADRDKAWETSYAGCLFLSPGSFARTGSFFLYRPCDGEYDYKQV
eukprot:Sspe_Gene.41776::Locus_20224_Transcript_1_1_Confidence_1.000_Length_2081::g.41776::m.41776/K02325/POLE2; DNA polymerase epsilon subunit 2